MDQKTRSDILGHEGHVSHIASNHLSKCFPRVWGSHPSPERGYSWTPFFICGSCFFQPKFICGQLIHIYSVTVVLSVLFLCPLETVVISLPLLSSVSWAIPWDFISAPSVVPLSESSSGPFASPEALLCIIFGSESPPLVADNQNYAPLQCRLCWHLQFTVIRSFSGIHSAFRKTVSNIIYHLPITCVPYTGRQEENEGVCIGI